MRSLSRFPLSKVLLLPLLATGAALMQAQQPVTATPSAPLLDLSLPTVPVPATFSSSSQDNELAVAERPLALTAMDEAQPPRRRYGRTRYRGGNTNADGSNKFAFMGGVGFTQPVGNTKQYFVPSYSFQVGAGRNFNRNAGVMLQFDWDNFALTQRTLSEQSYLYTQDPYPADYGLDAHSHVWSFSLDPYYNIAVREGLGAYLTAGVGFYHKTTQFTVPQTVEGYDYYGFLEQYQANEPIDSYSSNAVGFNGGIGLTYKLSRFSNEKLYGEIRYVVTLNSAREGFTVDNVNTTTYNGYNAFPYNSHRTTYLPVKFGVRF